MSEGYRNGRSFWGAVGLALLGVNTAVACNIPVFRYALENWRPDPYHVLVLSRGPLDDSARQLVDRLTTASQDADSPANLQVVALDVEQRDPAAVLAEEGRADRVPDWLIAEWKSRLESLASSTPQLVVLYPHAWDRQAWQADLTSDNVAHLLDSPARQEIAQRLLDGQSAVWVLLECTDAARNEAAWNQLQTQLQQASQVVELPARELIEAEDEFRPDIQIELRVEFSALRVSREDAAEQAFDSFLRGSEPDLRDFDDPIAIPVFGRGRTYFALVGNGIQSETVEENGRFLCGACSCQVKNENPGVDLLMSVGWDDKIGGSAMPPVLLPELTGIGALEVSTTAPNTPPDSTDPSVEVAASSPPAAAISPQEHQVAAAPASPTVASERVPDDTTAAPNHTPLATPADTRSVEETDRFQRRLTYGMLGGIAVASGAILVVTFLLRRSG